MRKIIKFKDYGVVLIINKWLGFMFEFRIGKINNWLQTRLQVYSRLNKQSPKPAFTNEQVKCANSSFNHVITLCKPRFLLEFAHMVRK